MFNIYVHVYTSCFILVYYIAALYAGIITMQCNENNIQVILYIHI